MKRLLMIFILTGLLCLNITTAEQQIEITSTAEKTCLPVSRKSIPLTDFNNPSEAELSPNGRWLLYGGKNDKNKKVSPVILMDLSTGKKTEFFPSYSLPEIEDEFFVKKKSGYGFANEGTIAWIWSGKNGIKLKSLPDGEERWIHRDKSLQIFHSGIQKDTGILWSMSLDKNYMEAVSALEKEFNSKTGEEKEKLRKELLDKIKNIPFIIRLVDMSTLSEIKRVLPNVLGNCNAIDHSLNLLHVHEDGSLYKIDLKTVSDPVKLFGPVEGLKLPHFAENDKGLISQCAITSDGLNIIRKPNEPEYLLRVVEEGKEFHLPSALFNLHVSMEGEIKGFQRPFHYLYNLLDNFIRYPFIVSSALTEMTSSHELLSALHSGAVNIPKTTRWIVHHIPSQKTYSKQNTKLIASPGGLFAFEGVAREKGNLLQAVLQPFDYSERRQILMELDTSETCLIMLDIKNNQAFLNTLWGDLFIIDTETGSIKRRDVGQCLSDIDAVSENTVILKNRNQNYTAHRFKEQCFEPLSDIINTTQALSQIAEASDPTDTSSLALLLATLENNPTKDQPVQTRQALWNILSRSPTLFLHLYRSFPSLSQMPVLPIEENFNAERKKKLEASTISLLKFTTEEYQASRLRDWKFLTLLRPFLNAIPEEDKSLYMEKITVSITNGATKAVPLLRDVFQSKLYYVTQGHVKELFGLKREPVSDITLIRKKPTEWSFSPEVEASPNPHLENQFPSPEEEENYNSFVVPLILSSDPIEGVVNTATDFGIHYAILEKLVRPVLKYQEAGSVLLDETVKWNLPKNGKQYRAHLAVSAKPIRNRSIGQLSGPNYDHIWHDHKMVGAIIVGSSLYGFSQTLLEEYLAYFQEQGFQFAKDKTSNLKEFLLEGIKNCELDYFLKESHSDGDERNIFRFNRSNYIAKGVRYGEAGRIEVVYIIFPPPFSLSGLKTDLLSNRELGQAMEEREKKGCGQLTYFNTSCWSDVKARYEIEAVNSPFFLNIPSISLTDTFLNMEGEAIHSLLHSYRNGLDFKGFRKALETNEGYQSKKSNLYIFPDQVLYYDYIFNLISVPLDLKIKLERKEGEFWIPLDPDEAL